MELDEFFKIRFYFKMFIKVLQHHLNIILQVNTIHSKNPFSINCSFYYLTILI